MEENDTRLNFIFDNLPVRGELVRLTDSYQTILKQQPYSDQTAKLLGEALSSIALLNGISKHDGRIILQFQGKKHLKLLSVHCSEDDQLRALIQTDDSQPDDKNMFEDGQMVLFYEPDNKGQRYQSIIEIVSPNIAQNMEHYFSQSEQTQTRIWIAHTKDSISAFMLQLMPDESDKKGISWEHVTALAETITDKELSTLSFHDILTRLFHEEQVRVFKPQPLKFGCACSKEKMQNAILATGKTEIDKILQEHDSVDVNCEYCGNEYSFDNVDITCLFEGQCHDDVNKTQH